MIPKILSQDSNYDEWCEQEIFDMYKEAAEYMMISSLEIVIILMFGKTQKAMM
jgi:hypothetical protein